VNGGLLVLMLWGLLAGTGAGLCWRGTQDGHEGIILTGMGCCVAAAIVAVTAWPIHV
jgi:hypothetical protein